MAPIYSWAGAYISRFFTNSSRFFTNSSRFFTNSSRFFTNSSRFFTISSRFFTNSSRFFTNSSRFFTNASSSQLFSIPTIKMPATRSFCDAAFPAKPYMTLTDGPNKTVGLRMTSLCALMCHGLAAMTDDVSVMLRDRLWENQVEHGGYNAGDFITIELFDKNKTELKSSMKKVDGEDDTVMSLVDMVNGLASDFRAMLNRLDDEYRESFDFTTEMDKIPVVSPHEIVLWCAHNKRDVREDMSTQPTDIVLGAMMANFLCSLGRPITQTPVPQFELVRGKKTTTFSEVFKPRVFFLCTGLTNVPGVTRHNCTHIGATQERLRSWKELQAVRRAARDESIPADVRQAWTAHLAQMEVAERGVGQDQLLAMT
ncbi:hypothetical protein G6O67_004611 [Ophiocordyceps sinensis]|uniref:Uncharacterized protein n=1 Tax=Ophiocordyceps sinensis TaxID=72228 RepID=A0A8H4PPU5_9HYPO|nr:hypothetical protein G6O67_004611 [Ophiocordyceps sinensis]